MQIDRCLCFGKPFAELAEVAARTGAASISDLQEHALFGRKCQLCHPYVRRMLQTGETAFASIVTDADEPQTSAGHSEERPARAESDPGASR